MLFVCGLVCYQKLVWFKNKKIKKSNLVFCFTCTLLLLASVQTDGSEIISHKKKVSHEKSVFSLQVRSFQSYNGEIKKNFDSGEYGLKNSRKVCKVSN